MLSLSENPRKTYVSSYSSFSLLFVCLILLYFIVSEKFLQPYLVQTSLTKPQYRADYLFSEGDSLSIVNAITIRMNVIDSVDGHVASLLVHYSECSVVESIYVYFGDKNEMVPLKMKFFKKVKWLTAKNAMPSIKTDAVFYIDSDVMVSCSDLEFTYNVWTSGKDSTVGYFPRLISKSTNGDFEYLGPMYVWWHGVYSLLSSSGIMVKKQIIETLHGNTKDAKTFQEALAMKPECNFLSISLWSMYKDSSPPIWVDVDIKYSSNAISAINIGKQQKYTQKATGIKISKCINMLASILNIQSFPHSSHKAAKAKNQFFW